MVIRHPASGTGHRDEACCNQRIDKALDDQFERRSAPFDGLTLQLDSRPVQRLVLDLQGIVSIVADPRKELRVFNDWWEHDAAVLPPQLSSWESLEAEVSDAESLVKRAQASTTCGEPGMPRTSASSCAGTSMSTTRKTVMPTLQPRLDSSTPPTRSSVTLR